MHGGPDGVSYTPEAADKLRRFETDPDTKDLGMCMVKTHLSLSHDPTLKCTLKGWTLPIRDILTYKGAGFPPPPSPVQTLTTAARPDVVVHRSTAQVRASRRSNLHF